MYKIYIVIALAILSVVTALYLSLEEKDKEIAKQETKIIKTEIEIETTSIAAKAIGEIKQIERKPNVKKAYNIGTHTDTF